MIRHTRSIAAYEAKTHFADLLDRVERGEVLTITRPGAPIARLVPIRRKTTREQRRAAIEGMRQLARRLKLRGLRVADLIREGRR